MKVFIVNFVALQKCYSISVNTYCQDLPKTTEICKNSDGQNQGTTIFINYKFYLNKYIFFKLIR